MHNFLLNYLRYRYSDQIIMYLECTVLKVLLIRVTLKYAYKPFKYYMHYILSK